MGEIRSEWLRPIEQRFLAGEAGPPPPEVRVAAVLSGVCAVAAAGMASVFVPMSVSIIRDDRLAMRDLAVSLPLAVTAIVLLFTFGIGAVAIVRRGWFRIPIYSGLVLGILALGAFWYAWPETEHIAFLSVRAGGAGLCAFLIIFLVRVRRAAAWLAKKRYQAARD